MERLPSEMTVHLSMGTHTKASGLACGKEHRLWRQAHLGRSLGWHFLVVGPTVRVSNFSDPHFLHLQNEEINTYQWRSLGKLNDFMYAMCLARNKHKVPFFNIFSVAHLNIFVSNHLKRYIVDYLWCIESGEGFRKRLC